MPNTHTTGDEVRISLRLPTALHQEIAERAKLDLRSLNAEIVHLLQVAASPKRS